MQKLLDSIAIIYQQDADTLEINGWHITRIVGGMNGLVYHAEREIGYPLAVKICQRDKRNRAGREYAAMQALDAAGSGVSPKPLYIAPDPPGLPGAAIISEWLAGKMLEAYPPPQDQASWLAILESLAQVHSLTPEESSLKLSNAATSIREPEDMLREINAQFARLPEGKIGQLERNQLEHLVAVATRSTPLRWKQSSPISLIHCDSNPNNMIEYDGEIRLVDWENSGWADPAFDIADICANPAYGMAFPAEHHAWIMVEHSRLLHDPTLPARAAIYTRLIHVWWVLRNGRYLVEANTRLKGVHQSSRETVLAQQTTLWDRACSLFQINPT